MALVCCIFPMLNQKAHVCTHLCTFSLASLSLSWVTHSWDWALWKSDVSCCRRCSRGWIWVWLWLWFEVAGLSRLVSSAWCCSTLKTQFWYISVISDRISHECSIGCLKEVLSHFMSVYPKNTNIPLYMHARRHAHTPTTCLSINFSIIALLRHFNYFNKI